MHASQIVGQAVLDHLRTRHGDMHHVSALVERHRAVGCWNAASPAVAPHRAALLAAIDDMASSASLDAVQQSVRDHADELCWRVDDGGYYDHDAPVGDGYRNGNMHTILAEGDDFAMGLFLLTPHVDYRDHRHAAPELYLNLTGPTDWRFAFEPWEPLAAGSVVWNEPGRIHATRSGDRPWLSFWAWLDDTDSPCEVVAP